MWMYTRTIKPSPCGSDSQVESAFKNVGVLEASLQIKK